MKALLERVKSLILDYVGDSRAELFTIVHWFTRPSFTFHTSESNRCSVSLTSPFIILSHCTVFNIFHCRPVIHKVKKHCVPISATRWRGLPGKAGLPLAPQLLFLYSKLWFAASDSEQFKEKVFTLGAIFQTPQKWFPEIENPAERVK